MRKLALGILLSAFTVTALAEETASTESNWIGGIGYANMSNEEDGMKISFGAVVGSLGYKIQSSDSFYIIPELRIGTGISDDNLDFEGININFEVDSFLALSLRGQLELDNGLYLFATPSYGNIEVTVSASMFGESASVTADEWEFGFGAGVGYNFSDSVSAELSFETYDGIDVTSFGLKFDF